MCIIGKDGEARLKDLMGREATVRIKGPSGDGWVGRIVAYSAVPGVLLEQFARDGLEENERRLFLPAHFTITELTRAEPVIDRLAALRETINGELWASEKSRQGVLTGIDWSIKALREMTEEVCCACGSPDVVYHNYREQPFCSPCADGKGANAPKPESSHQES
jgi:hypothetical protein